MQLTGSQRKELLEAMSSAYFNEDELERMVSFELRENLNAIAGGKDLIDINYQLVWAESPRKLEDLIIAAHNINSGNDKLKKFTKLSFSRGLLLISSLNMLGI